ncbi:MAG: pyridoxamine 5'-phosphate oxidase family protein [Pseudomonadota bacterium]
MNDAVFSTPQTLLAHVWDLIEQSVGDRKSAARYVTLASVGSDGRAEARVVVLRHADKRTAEVEIYTDGASAKVAEFQANPKGTLVFWDGHALQIRLRIDVTATLGDDASWAKLPQIARRNYGGQPAPGKPLEQAEDYVETTERDRFFRLRGTIVEIDVVFLGDTLHQRAVFERQNDFSGRWIGP